MRLVFTAVLLGGLAGCSPEPPQQWLKGNLHTHTLWSDGDAYPEVVVDWYKRNGYNFVALTDHNVLPQGEKWISTKENPFALRGDKNLEAYEKLFGPEWVQRKGDKVRLKTLSEFRHKFEEPDRFIILPGLEVTDGGAHVVVTNANKVMQPLARSNVENFSSAISSANTANSIGHLAHPNFLPSPTTDEILGVPNIGLFEVFNGVAGINTKPGRPTPDELWDQLLVKYQRPIFGVAVDDAHDYPGSSRNAAPPGRGWVMINAPELDPSEIVAALRYGRFYASSGVSLSKARWGGLGGFTLQIEIVPEPGVTYQTIFIGQDAHGVVRQLKVTSDLTPSYFSWGNRYVRARVTSSKIVNGEPQSAWVQPRFFQHEVPDQFL